MDAKLPQISVAQHLAERIAALRADQLPPAVKQKCEDLLIDVVGLCVTARKFRDLKVVTDDKELREQKQIEVLPNTLQLPEDKP